jgi:N-acetylglucosamine kinase-like BadF-type ATPase
MQGAGPYFLGVDVGGSKTHALIADASGHALGFGQSGPGNPESVGYERLARVLQEATDEALSAAGISREMIAGAGFGIGGYDWPSQRPAMLEAIGALGLSAPVEIVNDALIALLAGAEQGWGVAVVAGTSCNCWGRSPDGREGRMTGFSWLGEAAGAGELVLKALQAIALEWTRRGPATRLTRAFVELAGLPDVEALLEALTIGGLYIGAEAAPVVFRVAAEGDEVALELVRWAGRELASMAIGVIRQLDLAPLSFEVVLAGSFFNGSPLLAETMAETIYPVAPGARLVRLEVPPVVGAVILGMEQAGLPASPLRPVLIRSFAELRSYPPSGL